MFDLEQIKQALKSEIVKLPDDVQTFEQFQLFLKSYNQTKEIAMKSQDKVKFQYIRREDPRLCITVGTEIIDSEKFSHVFFAVSFKNPKDQFSKKLAREQVMDNFPKMDFVSGELILNKGKYTRYEIVEKILMHLHINNIYMTKDYKKFVDQLLYAGVW